MQDTDSLPPADCDGVAGGLLTTASAPRPAWRRLLPALAFGCATTAHAQTAPTAAEPDAPLVNVALQQALRMVEARHGVGIDLLQAERWADWPVSGRLDATSADASVRRLLRGLNYVLQRNADGRLELLVVGTPDPSTRPALAVAPPAPVAPAGAAPAPDDPALSGEMPADPGPVIDDPALSGEPP